jgi:hypothetical protein
VARDLNVFKNVVEQRSFWVLKEELVREDGLAKEIKR